MARILRSFIFFFIFSPQVCWAAAIQLDEEKSLSLSLSQSLEDATQSSFIDLTVRVPKERKGFKYIPQLSIFLAHHTIDLNLVTDNAADKGQDISGSMIGLRAGLAFPTRYFWGHPFFLFTTFTYARSSIQSDPWFGQPDEAIDDSPLHEVNMGVRTQIDQILLGYTFSTGDLEYLRSTQALTLGVIF